MRPKLLAVLSFASLLPIQAQADTAGYLSFSFKKGQELSQTPRGSFQDLQLGMIVSGELASRTEYLAEFRFEEGAHLGLEQAWLAFEPSAAFRLKLGLYLVPFGKYNLTNRPHQTALVSTPLNIGHLFPPRWKDIGVQAEGRAGSFAYSFYLGNGLAEGEDLRAGQQFWDNNADKGKGGRLALSFGPEAEIGYSLYQGKFDNASSRNLTLQGLEFTWLASGLKVRSEYTQARFENPAGFSPGKAEGYFIQADFDLDGFAPVASYQRLTYTDSFHGQGFSGDKGAGAGIHLRLSRWAVGLVYHLGREILFKVEYDINREKSAEQKNNLFVFQMALGF